MSKSRPGRMTLARYLASFAFVLGACAPAPTPTPGIPAPNQLTDANIGSIAQTYNAGEVQVAEMAVTKSMNPAVQAFSQTIVRDHQQANQQLAGILSARQIQPVPSSTTTEIQELDRGTMTALQTQTGANFDRTYMDSEIEHHRWIINQLDAAMIPQARDGSLENYLKAGRKLEESHLKEAEKIRASLGS